MKKAFTITELLVAIGLLAAVLAGTSMIFSYSIDAQRTASATAEIMRTLRAVTDQLNINLGGLQKDGHLFLWSGSIGTDPDRRDAIYFFSTGDFSSWYNTDVKSNIARVYFGPSRKFPQDSNNLALDFVLLTPGETPPFPYYDYNDANFADCRTDPNCLCLGEDPCNVLFSGRPDVNMAADSNDARRLLAQNVGSMKIEWTYGWFDSASTTPDRILWWDIDNTFASVSGSLGLVKSDRITSPTPGERADIASCEIPGPPYIAHWDSSNPNNWPKALKFTFMLYDSKKILKTGRRFEHIVYIGD